MFIESNVIGTEPVIEPENLVDREPVGTGKKPEKKPVYQKHIKYSYFKEKPDIFMYIHINPNHLNTNMQKFSLYRCR